MNAFVAAGGDEIPANNLYGEIPSAFPTILAQVNMVSAAEGRTVNVALVDGGVNDLDVELIVNPTVSQGEFVERWDGLIRDVGHDSVLELLGSVDANARTR